MALVDVTSHKEVSIPHEEGQWVSLRPLTGAQMQEAQEAQSSKAMEKIAKMNPEILQNLSGLTSEAKKTQEENPSEAYDKETLLRYGLVGWSYDAECNDENKGQLDHATYEWVIQEIVEMNIHSPLSASSSSP